MNAKIKDIFTNLSEQKTRKFSAFFIKSPSDIGTIRNLGRNGSCYGPDCILAQLKKLNLHDESLKLSEAEVTSKLLESENFKNAQLNESKAIKNYLPYSDKIIHLGGGHDHIYPLVKAIEEDLIILNIDPHADTRTSDEPNSGTPFRQLLNERKNIKIIEYGLHQYANSKETLSSLDDRVELIYSDELSISKLESIKDHLRENTTFILSLDADAIHAAEMSAVSAVNHQGIPGSHINEIIDWYKSLKLEKEIFGIYEYNPVYEGLDQKGARLLSSFLYQFIFT